MFEQNWLVKVHSYFFNNSGLAQGSLFYLCVLTILDSCPKEERSTLAENDVADPDSTALNVSPAIDTVPDKVQDIDTVPMIFGQS